ncbi:hypothetical protein HYC85_011074 [Camellia sinensis]|uniref:Uncharacterized protein n=1 Tax=Camellia sinensis TaxID=4442 RepID=A0A7J7HJR3_CAMSI|nr:hypothetical protein HYC85_011074 [Camellia sinensis]
METSQSLAIESFSYSWLTNRKFSLDSLSESLIPSLDASDEAVSEEAKYKILSSKRSLEESHNFNFDIPISKSLSLVHADEIFYQGHILPRYSDDQSKKDDFNALNSNSVLSIPISSRNVCAADRIHCGVLKKWRKTSKRIVQKCLGFFRPLCLKVGFSRRSIRVDDIDMNVWEEEVKHLPHEVQQPLWEIGGCEKRRVGAIQLWSLRGQVHFTLQVIGVLIAQLMRQFFTAKDLLKNERIYITEEENRRIGER